MCGIAGYVSRLPVCFDGGEVLRTLQSRLHHRGPDDRGIYSSADQRCGLVNTRLAVLDLTAAGHQPMRSVDGHKVIVFNGEIYNFRDLREELEASGASFRSGTDTEVVLQLYERHGPASVDRLRGMFALAIWDERERTCLLARDPLGIKPLYYYHDTRVDNLLFASELRPLVVSGVVPKAIDPQGLYGYFRSGSVPEPLTMIAGVRCLEPGTRLLWREGGVQSERFWSARFGGDDRSAPRGDPAAAVRGALIDSVASHFVSDVDVGLFLSGGIDSTAILALAKAAGRENVRTFSIGFADAAAADESAAARRTAGHFQSRHAERRLDRNTGRALFEQFLPNVDQPSIDGFNTFAVSRFARAEGIKVALSGLGGDELFGGYPSFRQLPRMVFASRLMGPLRGAASRVLASVANRGSVRRLADFLSQPPTLANAYSAYRGIHTRAEALTLVSRVLGAAVSEIATMEADPGLEFPTAGDEISSLELQRYMTNQLLRDSDVMSMANGLELRLPMVDREVVATVAGIPATQRLSAGKDLLLRAVPEIPPWVAGQPKRGFCFPFETWMAGEWGASLASLSLPPRAWFDGTHLVPEVERLRVHALVAAVFAMNRPLRVLHVITSLSKSQGGPAVALPLLARALVESGLEVTIVTTDDDGPRKRLDVPLGEPVGGPDGATYLYFPKQSEFYRASWPLTKWLWKHVREFDLVHIHALFTFTSTAAGWIAHLRGVPYVIRPLGVLNRWGNDPSTAAP